MTNNRIKLYNKCDNKNIYERVVHIMDDKEKQKLENLNARYKKQNEAIKENYDRVSVTLPKGTKERIKATGESINGFIIRSVLADLDRLEVKAEQTGTAEQAEDKPPFME